MAITTGRESNNPVAFKVVGTNPIRHDGVDKVTGRAKYGADILLAGLLHGKILRSPHAHAGIRSIDTSKAEALPGVTAVLTSKDFAIIGDQRMDFGEARGSVRMVAENVMAGTKVLYKGHAIAAVAATSPHIAEEALKLINVDYELLPPVMTIHDAMEDGVPLLLENITTRFRAGRDGNNEDTGVISNVTDHVEFRLGNLEQGFKEADVVVEREFHTSMVHQGYIEPHTSTGLWNPDGRVTIWTSTQGSFPIRTWETGPVS